jgi:hypothetical protein
MNQDAETKIECPGEKTISEITFAGIAPFSDIDDMDLIYTHKEKGISPVGFDYCGDPEIL